MKCNCKSYNLGVGKVEEVSLQPFWREKEILVDSCIAKDIEMLWKNGIMTGSSCCGHNGVTSKSLVLIHENDVQKAKDLLDDTWEILVWKLINYEQLLSISN